MTLRAFLPIDDLPLDAAARTTYAAAAQHVHEQYVRSVRPSRFQRNTQTRRPRRIPFWALRGSDR